MELYGIELQGSLNVSKWPSSKIPLSKFLPEHRIILNIHEVRCQQRFALLSTHSYHTRELKGKTIKGYVLGIN